MTATSEKHTTCFSEGLDQIARERGGWDSGAVVYQVECVNADQVLLTGAAPAGHRRNGRIKFAPKCRTFKAVVSISEYRAAIAKATA